MFDFPTAPLLNEEVTHSGGAVYIWDGQKWRAKRGAPPFDPEPLIAAIFPTQAQQNQAFTLIVNGTYFETTSTVTLDGGDVPTVYGSAVELTTDVPAQPYGKTSLAVNVRDTVLARMSNADLILTLIDPRVPLITAISPTSSNQGVAFTLTVTGTGFIDGTQITLNGAAVATAFVSATSLTTQIAAQAYGPGSTMAVNVTGPNPGSNPNQTLTIVDSRPVVSSITPVAGVQNEAITLTATGTFFRADTPITVNGTAIPTTFVSATQLTASYTCGYFHPDELGAVNISVAVSGSLSPPVTVNFIDPRFKVRSCYPDYWSQWVPVDQVEVWGWGPLSDQSVVYLDGQPKITRMQLNGVGTELILIFDFEGWPANDGYYPLEVLNASGHWSAGTFQYYVERIGLNATGPNPPSRRGHMAFDFPASPAVDEIFTDPTTGATYKWTGEKWLRQPDVAPPPPPPPPTE